jgi:hypothetical protein
VGKVRTGQGSLPNTASRESIEAYGKVRQMFPSDERWKPEDVAYSCDEQGAGEVTRAQEVAES